MLTINGDTYVAAKKTPANTEERREQRNVIEPIYLHPLFPPFLCVPRFLPAGKKSDPHF
jgi:hypothetical protein